MLSHTPVRDLTHIAHTSDTNVQRARVDLYTVANVSHACAQTRFGIVIRATPPIRENCAACHTTARPASGGALRAKVLWVHLCQRAAVSEILANRPRSLVGTGLRTGATTRGHPHPWCRRRALGPTKYLEARSTGRPKLWVEEIHAIWKFVGQMDIGRQIHANRPVAGATLLAACLAMTR